MNDELTAQVLELQQQMNSRNKSEHSGSQTPNFGSRIPIREGSFLSDYVKTKRGVRSSVSSGKVSLPPPVMWTNRNLRGRGFLLLVHCMYMQKALLTVYFLPVYTIRNSCWYILYGNTWLSFFFTCLHMNFELYSSLRLSVNSCWTVLYTCILNISQRCRIESYAWCISLM